MPFRADGEGYLHEATQERLDVFLDNAREINLDAAVAIHTFAPGHTPNEALAELIAPYLGADSTPRLLGCVTVNPLLDHTPELDEMHRAADEWDFRTVKLMAAGHQYHIDDPMVDPFMAAARELNLVATIHSGGDYAHAARIVRLAERHPDVPIVMDHMGFPDGVDEAIEGAARLPSIHLMTTILRFFSDDPDGAAPPQVRDAVERAGAEKVVFGSNQAEYRPAQVAAAIERLDLGAEAEALIFGENLKRVYGL
ncbi:MAG: amidohydrolase family protein [Chloroflexota bacterium]|nr:amidohydrolase family protein [Chloroflexota bacterium]